MSERRRKLGLRRTTLAIALVGAAMLQPARPSGAVIPERAASTKVGSPFEAPMPANERLRTLPPQQGGGTAPAGPAISLATYLGSDLADGIAAVETDASGNVFVFGTVPDAASFVVPLVITPFYGPQFLPNATNDCYVAKFVPDVTLGLLDPEYFALVHDSQRCDAMAVAPSGDVYIARTTASSDVVIEQFSYVSPQLTRTNSFLLPQLAMVSHLRVDDQGHSYAVGECANELFPGELWPLPNGFQPRPAGINPPCVDSSRAGQPGGQHLMVAAGPQGQLFHGSFFGFGTSQIEPTSVELDNLGRLYIAGHTNVGVGPTILTTPNAFMPQPGDAFCTPNTPDCEWGDAFLLVYDTRLQGNPSYAYASYLGGTDRESDVAMALAPDGRVHLVGTTQSATSFPGIAFATPTAIFHLVIDPNQPLVNQFIRGGTIVEGHAASVWYSHESGARFRLRPDGTYALLASSDDPAFPLVDQLFGATRDPNAFAEMKARLLVYNPANDDLILSTYLDDVTLAHRAHLASAASGTLYVAMLTTEPGRSPSTAPIGQDDVLVFAIDGIRAPVNRPPTVSILDRLAGATMTTVYADSPTGGRLELLASAFDPDGDPLTYSWSGPFTNDPPPTSEFVVLRVPVGTQQTITVAVDDGHGNIVSASRTFDVVGTPFIGTTARPIDSTLNALVVDYAPVTMTATAIGPGFYQAYLRTRLDQLPPIPGNLQAGSPPMYFDVSSDAVFVAPVSVCIDTRGMSFANPTGIRLHHLQQAGQLQFWTDITSAGYPQGNQLCGQANALGTFAIFYPQVPDTAVRTIAGNGVLTGSIDGPGGNLADDFVAGPATATSLGHLFGGAYDRANNRLFFSDGSHILRLDLGTGTIARVAGNGVGMVGSLDGPGGDPRDDQVEGGDAFTTFVGFPRDLVLTPAGDVLFFEGNTCRIRRLDLAQSLLFTVAGIGVCAGSSGDGFSAGLAAISSGQMVFDAAGNLFIAEHNDGRVRRIDAQTNVIDTVAGDGTFGTPVHGAPARSAVSAPMGIAFDAQGQLLVAAGMHLLRVSTGAADGFVDGDPDEVISVIGGCNTNCQVPFNGDGLAISNPQVHLGLGRLMVARDGAVISSDSSRIRRIAPGADGIVIGAGDEVISTIGGYFDWASLSSPFNGDTFSTQSLFGPNNVIVEDTQNGFIVVDGSNHRVRRFGLAPSAPNPGAADLALSANDTPDPVNAGSSLGYAVTVTNNGPASATAVTVIYVMPAAAVFESAPAFCSAPAVGSTGTVSCSLGTLASGASATVSIAVTPQAAGSLASTFTVTAVEVDPNAGNDVATVTTTVNLAPVVITVHEGIVVTDGVNVLPSALIAISESIAVADAVQVLPSAMIDITESIAVADTVNLLPAVIITVDESITVTDSVNVVAVDTTPPVVAAPAAIVVAAILPNGTHGGAATLPGSVAVANFLNGSTAIDDVDPAPVNLPALMVDCGDPAVVTNTLVSPGTVFPVGTTCVRFTWRDAAGNTGTAVSSITVNPPIGGHVFGPGVPVVATDANNVPQPVTVNFLGGTGGGGLVQANPIVPPPTPAGFSILGVAYDITTTVPFTPPIQVCFTGQFQTGDVIYHNGVPVPTTIGGGMACATVNALSPFMVLRPLDLVPPIAILDVAPRAIAGSMLKFSGARSFDFNGSVVSYRWIVPDANLDVQTTTPSYVIPAGSPLLGLLPAGVPHTVTLIVTDGGGNTSQPASATLEIFGSQSRTPANGGPTGGATLPINIGPGDKTDPHVSLDLASYTDVNSGTIRYFRFSTGVDSAIPGTPGYIDTLSDVNQERVVFSRQDPTGKRSVVLFDVASGSQTHVSGAFGAYNPFETALGQNTAAFVDGKGGTDSDLVAVDIPTGARHTLDPTPDADVSPRASPDGNTVVWNRCAPTFTNCDVFKAVRSAGTWITSPFMASGSHESSPDTDGTWIVYDSDRPTSTGGGDIYFQPIGGGTEVGLNIAGLDSAPSISGGVIAFTNQLLTPARDLYVYVIATNRLYRVTSTPTIDEMLTDISVLPNGDVRLVWAASTGIGGAHDIYATTFSLAPRPTLTVNPHTTPARFGSGSVSATLTSNGAPVVGETVDFFVNGGASGSGLTDANGVASSFVPATLLFLSSGIYPGGVEARYGGSTALPLASAAATADLTVTPGFTALGVSAAPSPSTFGQSVTITARTYGFWGVPGVIDFAFRQGQVVTPIGSSVWDPYLGTSSVVTSSLPAGTLELIASFAGNADNLSSTASVAHTVTKTPTTVHLSSSRNPSLTTSPPIFHAVVQTTATTLPTGKVEFSAGGVLLCRSTVFKRGADFTASCGGAPLAAGSHQVSATFLGDAGFDPSTSPALTQTIHDGSYVMFDLGVQGEASAISPGGWVAGNSVPKSSVSTASTSTAFVHDGTFGATATTIPSLGGSKTVAVGVDNSGRAAGFGTTSTGATHTFLFDGTNTLDHHNASLGGLNSQASAMNANGTIVGLIETAGGLRGFIDIRGGAVDLGTLPGGTSSAAFALSELQLGLVPAHIVGVSSDAAGNARATSFMSSPPTDLGALPGGTSSAASAVNNAGEAAGFSNVGGGARQAFVYRDGAMVDIGSSLGSSLSLASAINDAGEVAGAYVDISTGLPVNRVFLHSLGTTADVGIGAFADLNNAGALVMTTTTGRILVKTGGTFVIIGDATSGVVTHQPPVVNATAMNDDGRIAGSILLGNNLRAVVWIPVPASTLVADAVSGPAGAAVTLKATLTSTGGVVANRSVLFRLNGADVGSALTDAAGVATLPATIPTLAAGVYPTGVEAFFAGDATIGTAFGAAVLTVVNQPPVVDAGPDVVVTATSAAGASVALNGTATDADGNSLTLTWSGPCGTATGASVTLTCAPGVHVVTFTADDGFGGVVSDTVTVTVTVGTPSLRATVVGRGTDARGYFIDLRLNNHGTGHARNVIVKTLQFRTLSGSGAVTFNAAAAGPLPIQVGSIDIGAAQVVRLYLNLPGTVSRFSIVENGTLENVVGATSSFSFAQTVIP
jgi:uncharacterized repeat protein (TIGR01451 family)